MTVPDLSPQYLFDLDGFAHRSLFDGLKAPWEALGQTLKDFLTGLLDTDAQLLGQVDEGAVLVGEDIHLGAGSRIEAGAYVKGPCWIGEGVEVRHGAYIRGNVYVGHGAVVGHATEVKGSIFFPGAKAGHFAYVGDSILGRDVNLGAGTKLANLRLAGDTVLVKGEGFSRDSGLRKFGAILADGVQTGCNSVLNPGTILATGCLVHPCTVASGYHPPLTTLR